MPCPVQGNLIVEFNQYNNGYYILATPRNHATAIYRCTLSDSTTTKPLELSHTQAAYVIGDRKVVVPFTLTFYSVTGETVNVTVTGVTESGKMDPFSITVYTLKELILRDWRKEWDQPPREPSAIRLIHFGRMLEDRMPLSRMSTPFPFTSRKALLPS